LRGGGKSRVYGRYIPKKRLHRPEMMSKCGDNKKVAHEPSGESVTDGLVIPQCYPKFRLEKHRGSHYFPWDPSLRAYFYILTFSVIYYSTAA